MTKMERNTRCAGTANGKTSFLYKRGIDREEARNRKVNHRENQSETMKTHILE